MSGVKTRSALPRVLRYWVARDSVSCFTIRAHGMSQPGHCLSLCFSKSVERPLSAVAAPDLELSVANDFHFDIIRVVVWTKLPAFCYRQSREENRSEERRVGQEWDNGGGMEHGRKREIIGGKKNE